MVTIVTMIINGYLSNNSNYYRGYCKHYYLLASISWVAYSHYHRLLALGSKSKGSKGHQLSHGYNGHQRVVIAAANGSRPLPSGLSMDEALLQCATRDPQRSSREVDHKVVPPSDE